jgi:hypothetical protein
MARWGEDRLGGQLTTDNLLQTLAALGTPAVLVADEPTRADFLELLGCLLASTEAALMGMDPAELTTVRDGYRSQIGNSDDGVLRLLSTRLNLLPAAGRTPDIADRRCRVWSAPRARPRWQRTGSSVHQLTRPDQTGRPAESAPGSLREVKQHVANTHRGFDRVLDILRGRGV